MKVVDVKGLRERRACIEASDAWFSSAASAFTELLSGVRSTEDLDNDSPVEKARKSPESSRPRLVKGSCAERSSVWNDGLHSLVRDPITIGYEGIHSEPPADGPHVVAIDYGMKWNIPRHLRQLGCRVTIVPGTLSAEQILELNPAGIFLSNGPGDPQPLDYAISTIQGLLGKAPIFGICLGNQLLGLACGLDIFKLRFGHRGANQPVLNKATGRVEITSQNHGFALAAESVPSNVEVTHINLNDQTIEGISHKDYPAFAVQYHPEASAGPHDSHYLFGQFREMLLQHA